jgi:hypothetical protein
MKRALVPRGLLRLAGVAAVAPPESQTEAQSCDFPQRGLCATDSAFAEHLRIGVGAATVERSPETSARSTAASPPASPPVAPLMASPFEHEK